MNSSPGVNTLRSWPVRRPAWPVSPGRADSPRVFDSAPLWTHPQPLLAFLRERYGALRLHGLEGSYGWVLKYDQMPKARATGIETLGDFLDAFGRAAPGTLPYLMHLSLQRALPELLPHFAQPPGFTPNWVTAPWLDRLAGPELFLGQAGSGFGPIHQDHASVHVGFWQVQGEKQFILFPPEDGRWLYRYSGAQFPYECRNSRVHARSWRDFERFPLLRYAHPKRLVLRAGQCLFLPANWWHSTINLTDSVSYSIRIVNGTNAVRTLGAYAFGVTRAVLRALGR